MAVSFESLLNGRLQVSVESNLDSQNRNPERMAAAGHYCLLLAFSDFGHRRIKESRSRPTQEIDNF